MINRIQHKITRIQKKLELNRAYRKIDKAKNTIKSVEIPNDQSPIVLCLLKNGDYFISDFMNHYLNLGFKHFVFIDNGSTDSTIAELEKFNVTLLACELPYKEFKYSYKQYLVKAFAKKSLVALCRY